MPEMTVWPVSSSVRTWKVGSSSDSEKRALPILSWSALVLGSTATWITGSGKTSSSSTIGCLASQSVSPVRVFLRPMPGDDVAGEDGVEVLAVVGVHLRGCGPTRSLLPVRMLRTCRPCRSCREYTRKYVSLPTWGSVMILNASADERLVVVGLRSSSRRP